MARIRDLLRHQEKLASIGLLAAGVTQEIRKPIAFIRDSLRLLEDSFTEIVQSARKCLDTYRQQDGDTSNQSLSEGHLGEEAVKIETALKEVNKLFSQSFEEIERVHQILADLTCYSKNDESVRETMNIHECLDAALRIVHSELKYQVKVRKAYGELPEIRCYPRAITQAFVNLFINSAQAIPDRGELIITTQSENGHVVVLIKDDGTGIPESLQHRVFDPFFTTKEAGQGSGLGLCIVEETIQKHGGTITFTSIVGRGTEFRIELPIENQKSNP
ncbi:hypothetical protein KKC97_13170 [bacterium]|nr:hypothetical protein [bacterium]